MVDCVVSLIISAYRFLFSAFSGRQCRFEPTCSHYIEQSFRNHSIAYAFYLSLSRLVRCCGFWHWAEDWTHDPVPDNVVSKRKQK